MKWQQGISRCRLEAVCIGSTEKFVKIHWRASTRNWVLYLVKPKAQVCNFTKKDSIAGAFCELCYSTENLWTAACESAWNMTGISRQFEKQKI